MTVADASGYRLPVYEFRRPAELGSGEVSRHPVIIIGGGLCGLTDACDLASMPKRASRYSIGWVFTSEYWPKA